MTAGDPRRGRPASRRPPSTTSAAARIPDDAVAYLVQALGIGEGRDVLELGAGTGKFTELIVHRRADHRHRTGHGDAYSARTQLPYRDGPRRASRGDPRPGCPADAVVAAQAFHWFDGDRALPEIHRVLRPDGFLGMIWNVRDEASDWSERLTAIFDRLPGDVRPGTEAGAGGDLTRTEPFGPLHHRVAYHVHHVTPETFLDRASLR